MNNNIKVIAKTGEAFSGRLIDFISDEECRAAINTEDAARRIYSAPTLAFMKISHVKVGKRFVVATSDKNRHRREVFISPQINHIAYANLVRVVECVGGAVYTLKEL